MEYQSILKGIEEQKKDRNLSAKLFRYTGLMQAIEFFSQKLNYEQIIDAAFDFVNELLITEGCALFILNEDEYVLRKFKGNTSKFDLSNTDIHKTIATYHGTIISGDEHLGKFFNEKIIENFKLNFAIPMIIENYLFGIILVSNDSEILPGSDDSIIAESLMKLINNSLENYKRYEELQKANKELDEKIFNLFAINHSSKALLSELDIDILQNLSIDVFSELTQSAITAFIIYDDKSEKYLMKGFRDIFKKVLNLNVELTLNKKAKIDANKLIINTSSEQDIKYFNNIFIEGYSKIEPLEPKYIILLCKNSRILGFVTLSQTVTGNKFNKGVFELIESLSASTYTAISNAKHFSQVNEQKIIIKNKLDKLMMLNKLMKNINSSSRIETLIEMTLKTLSVSFDVDRAIFALSRSNSTEMEIIGNINTNTSTKIINMNDKWKSIMQGRSVFEVGTDCVEMYFGKQISEEIQEATGVLIVPICIERVDIEILGILTIFKYKNVPISDEENLLIIESIAGHISPVLSNLSTIEDQARFLLPNYIEMFKRDLKDEISDALECKLPLQVLEVRDTSDYVFGRNSIIEKLKNHYHKVFPLTNNIIFIISENVDNNCDLTIREITDANDLIVKSFVFGKDFMSYQEFFALF
jgi:transcriptional regulator with GAF, ATPase, and Fis domain